MTASKSLLLKKYSDSVSVFVELIEGERSVLDYLPKASS